MEIKSRTPIIHIWKLSGGTFCGNKADILNTVLFENSAQATCKRCLRIKDIISGVTSG